ncbi:glucose-1-phosphate cytidylyltransferase [Clostridium botulinum]|uniref:glucose-1-phosphate cytidylyltransferase n=1 Tax=Clostridium botulinum TaxID=1491 RepID=UPI0013FEB75A|nr:glucose-1-phosphate cytidylyltransferase [Clostridium botulinum]MBN1073451.1 glucose-1-phosphate cytidylyltransferase [Clostridium botulinum]NFN14997.1 glucose-1-phosphate cytidylyltransferase [Clostridium botulinum]
MKVVILAGGYGTRISEESHLKPKPMIEIGGDPILWHIMKYYSYYGFNEFIICCGYKGYMIKEYFADYYLHRSDITFDFAENNKMTIHSNVAEPWKVTLVDTGLDTMTGGRLKRVKKYVENETFMLTYGDGICDVDINELLAFHEKSNKIATITAIQPGGRFGVLDIAEDNTTINSFSEKSKEDGGWINGGYMVLGPRVFDYIKGDETFLEKEPLEELAREKMLSAYKHNGFWQCMDTKRDKELLEVLWKSKVARWKKW